MTAVMKGVRVLEVAEHTFVPAASALLTDWGAEVIKIEHYNRGKQSLGLDLTSPEGLDILHRLTATCDVLLTNKLPSVRGVVA